MYEQSPARTELQMDVTERYKETEHKLMCHPYNAAAFDVYKGSPDLHLIRQVYLSHPTEPFSLRLREKITSSGDIEYSAALKTAGTDTADGLSRDEIETEITAETFAYYTAEPLPTVHKMSAHISPALSIDWVEGVDETPLIEIEDRSQHPESEWFFERHGHQLAPVTAPMRSMEELAHALYDKSLHVPEAPSAAEVIARIDIARLDRSQPLVVAITGRSGSGKSTIVREIAAHYEGTATVSMLSTDDYHRGKTWLEAHNNGQPWQNWELPIVYDTAELANDLSRLLEGETIPRQTIDFGPCERTVTGDITPADIVLVEGLYAGSPDIAPIVDITVNISTPVSTCISRRVFRDMRERPDFSDPSTNLRYILETVEPAYRAQSH